MKVKINIKVDQHKKSRKDYSREPVRWNFDLRNQIFYAIYSCFVVCYALYILKYHQLNSFLPHGCDQHMENNNYGLTLTPRRITILSVIFFQLCGVFGGT